MAQNEIKETVRYTTSLPWKDEKAKILVIKCSASNVQPYFTEFLQKSLGFIPGSYDVLSVPGGPQFFLSSNSVLPKLFWSGKYWTKFLADAHKIKEVICISHDRCVWYDHIYPNDLILSHIDQKEKSDLIASKEIISNLLPRLQSIRLFHALPNKGYLDFIEIE